MSLPNIAWCLLQLHNNLSNSVTPVFAFGYFQQDPNIIVTVDNCYGEFTDVREPPDVGADLCMGSLIKNPGASCAGLDDV